MPPKRKALDPADANAAGPSSTSNKKSKPDVEPQTQNDKPPLAVQHEKRWSKVSGSKNLDESYLISMRDPKHAYEFMCICNPIKSQDDMDNDDDDWGDEDDGEQAESEGEPKKRCDAGKTCNCGKTAASVPDHEFTMSRAGIARFHLGNDMVNLRNPDAFGMYTYNDHMAYGTVEVIKNLFLDFDEAYKAERWKELWAITEGIALFWAVGRGDTMALADDGEGMKELARMIGRMALTALGALDKAGLLKKDSEIKNLGWVMEIYQGLVSDFRAQGLMDESEPSKAKTFRFKPDNLDLYMRAYARTHDIPMPGVKDLDNDEEITMPKKDAKDPWGWAKGFSGEMRQGVGDHLDITAWTSAKRKQYAFDNKDPLPKDVMNKIKQGLCMTLG